MAPDVDEVGYEAEESEDVEGGEEGRAVEKEEGGPDDVESDWKGLVGGRRWKEGRCEKGSA